MAASRPGTVTGGSSARTGPAGVSTSRHRPGGELRVGGELRGRAQPGAGDAGLVQQGHHRVRRHGSERGLDDRRQLAVVGHPVRVGGEPLVGDQVRPAKHPLAEHGPLAVVLQAQEHLPAQVGAVRGDGRVPGAGAPDVLLAVDGVVVGLAHPLAQGVQQGHLEAGSAAGALPLVQRGQHPAVGVHPGGDVGDRDARLARLVRGAGDRKQPGLALHQQVIGLLAGVGAVRPVAGDRAADQPRVPGAELVGAQAQPLGRAGREVLHEDVGPVQQGGQRRLAVGALHVELHRFLAPVQPHEVARLAEHGPVVAAGEVAGARPLDLDDPGAEVGELPGGEGHRDGLLQRDHHDPRQREDGLALRGWPLRGWPLRGWHRHDVAG